MRSFISVLILLAIFSSANAQQPFSFNRVNLTEDVPTRILPQVNAEVLLAEDAANINKDIPYRFGYKHSVNIGNANAGVTETMKDGSTLWRVGIKCPGAFSVNLVFDQFHLPEGALLYIYSIDKSYIVGPYSSRNNTWDSKFGTDLVKGEEIIVEYFEPAFAAFHGQLNINGVTHAYRDPFQFAKAFGDAGSCQINVNCPEGNNWQNEKRAVALIMVGGSAFCTGAMVGNVAMDGTPYFLTANHCLGGDYSTWVFRFNYESLQCTPSQNGITSNTVNGATLKANYAASDMGLLLLNSQPNPVYQVYYAGWNNQNIAPSSSVAIHHPSGDVKKISFDDGAATTMGWGTTGTTHWYVDWDNACTEGGSSGSPLFDQNHRVVGQLHGGPSSCTSSDQHDYYGKFSTSWTGGGAASSRLKDWLDPQNTGATVLDGYFFGQATDTLNVALLNVQSPAGNFCFGDSIIPTVTIRNDGLDTLTFVNVTYVVDSSLTVTQAFNLSIPTYGIQTVALQPFLPEAGSHSVMISVSDPNNGIDANTDNNVLTTSFNVVTGDKIIIEIKTDNYPEETSYIFTSANGDTLLAGNSFATPNTVYTSQICVQPACYTFKIFDQYGDGMCCTAGNGYFKVMDENGNVLSQGGDFNSSQTAQICLYDTVPTAAFATSVNTVCAGQSLTFTNSSEQASAQQWIVSGPANASATSVNYNYIFALPGTYSIALVAINNVGNDTFSTSITVHPKPQVTLITGNGSVTSTVNSGTPPFSYSWNTGSTETGLSGLASGTYKVTVTDLNGCTGSATVIVTATEITSLAGAGISLYPNPTMGIVVVENPLHLPRLEFGFYDAVGRLVRNTVIENSLTSTIDLNDLSAGVYTVRINTGVETNVSILTIVKP